LAWTCAIADALPDWAKTRFPKNEELFLKRFCFLLPILFVLLLAAGKGVIRRGKPGLPSQFHPASDMTLNVRDFQAVGDGKTDDTAAFARALHKLDERNGGTLLVPSGKYVVGDLKIGSGTLIKGTGPAPFPILLKALKARSIIDISSQLGSKSRVTLHDIGIEQLTLRGRSVEDGFSEHIHNINAVGVTNLAIWNVRIEAFQGDGLYLGARLQHADPGSHNSNIHVSDSVFDGMNSQNRNGISVIDCIHCVLERNEFANLSRSDMPGAIDIEPNQLDEITQDIVIRKNTIKNNHGNAGAICAVITMEHFHGAGQILIENNRIQDATNGIMVLWRGDEAATARLDSPQAVIRGNILKAIDRPLILDGAAGMAIVGNEILGSRLEAQIGFSFGARSVSFVENRFDRIGTDSGHGLVLFGPVASVNFERNSFGDVGSKKRGGSAIYFARGSVKNVTISGNIFASPNHQTEAAIRSASTVSLSHETNIWTTNTLRDGIQAGTFPHPR
jgi:hypothetical protein